LDIAGDDAQGPADVEDDNDEDNDHTNKEHLPNSRKKFKKKKSKKSSKGRKLKQAPSPICIDSDDDIAPSDRLLSTAEKSTKNKSATGNDPVKKEPCLDQNGEAQSNPNPAGSVSPLEADVIPMSLVTTSFRDDGEDAGVTGLPQPATNVKPMKRPNWREELKSSGMNDDKLLAKLREISKSAHLG
jgi:hypothetical protein